MGGQELAVKYSNEIYATQKDIKKDLHTNLIDGIWTQVLKYRSNFIHTLRLRHVDATEYSVCLTPKITDKINSIERKLLKLSSKYKDLLSTKSEAAFSVDSKIFILKEIAKIYNLEVAEDVIYRIASGNVYNIDPQLSILTRYNNCIDYIARFPLEQVDENTIGNLYSMILGTEDLTEFYRTTEINNKLSKYLVGKTYLGIPCKLIESNMDQLINFITYHECGIFIKAVCAFYFIYYVKPFESYSEEIAVLMLKKILSCNDYEESTAYVNFEAILNHKEELENVIFECQRTYDLTYLLWFLFDKVDSLIEDALTTAEEAEHKTIRNDFFQKDVTSAEKEATNTFENCATLESDREPLNVEEMSVKLPLETAPITPIEEVEDKEVETIDKTPEIVDSTSTEQTKVEVALETPKTEVITTKPVENVPVAPVKFDQTIAISVIPANLTEEEASKLENRLIEMNPILTRGQAYFYARHCTVGMSYTIAQYKKEVGCAYETARCSMDGLVTLGYYSKKQLKNKYIYTPIKRN